MKKMFKGALYSLFILVILGSNVVKIQSQEIYFLQEDKNDPLIKLYNEALKTINVAAYVITSSDIAEALVTAKRRGVIVKLLLDERQTKGNKFSKHSELIEARIEIRVMSAAQGRMTSDFGIIDGKIVYTGGTLLHSDIQANPKFGSYLIYRDNLQLEEKFQMKFNDLFGNARNLEIP